MPSGCVSSILDVGDDGCSPFGQGFLTIGYAVVGSSWTLGWSLRLAENRYDCSGFALGGAGTLLREAPPSLSRLSESCSATTWVTTTSPARALHLASSRRF